MKGVIALLILVFVALIAAQPPSPPVWPTYFSASVGVFENNGMAQFFRWFYDASQNMDRFDGENTWQGEPYFATRIFNHVIQQETVVYFQQELAVCFQHTINRTIPKPPLNLLNYQAKGIVNFQPVYQWSYTQPNNFSFTYYDSQTYREPVRIDFSDYTRQPIFTVTYVFYEFDETAQDTSLFQISPIILATCNSGASGTHKGFFHRS